MKGSVRKRYNNAWSYRIDLGFVDGKRKQVEKGGFKTEREATKAMQDVLYHLNNTATMWRTRKFPSTPHFCVYMLARQNLWAVCGLSTRYRGIFCPQPTKMPKNIDAMRVCGHFT